MVTIRQEERAINKGKEKGEKGKKGNRKKEGKRWFLVHTENRQNLFGEKNHIFPQGERISYIFEM